MGYGAGPDPASARPKPGALLGRHRNHAAELREVDAFYGGAGSGFLADPAICLSASLRALRNPEAAVLFKSRERKLSSPERRGTAPKREIRMLTEAELQLHAGKIRDDGYTVIERAADDDLVEGL